METNAAMPPAYSTFDLDEAIRSLHERTEIADADEFADALLAGIPPDHLREVARQALAVYVRRWRTFEQATPLAVRVAHSEAARKAAPASTNGASPPNARFLGLVDLMLHDRVWTGTEDKIFGQFTVADLNWQIAAQKRQAETRQAKAKWLAKVRYAMQKHSASMVADLPNAVLRELAAARGGSK